jgi:glycosyltransferase involved in cell wall biosynthesis
MITTKSELVSVVIPTYNHAHFLGRALKSVLDQSYQNWEAIVIDNHSQDNTDEVVGRFVDPRINLLKIHNNGVIAASRNIGIRAAKGEWIAFLDSDDWWMPNKLSECIKMSNESVDFLYHDLTVVREKWTILGMLSLKSRQLNKPVLVDLLAGGNVIVNSSVVVRRRLLMEIGCIDEDRQMIGCEDYRAWLRIAQLSDNFSYVPKVLGYYLVHGNGISRKDMSLPMQKATAPFARLLNKEQLRKHDSRELYAKARSAYLTENNYGEIKKYFLFCLRNGSLNIRIRSAVMLIAVLIRQSKAMINN